MHVLKEIPGHAKQKYKIWTFNTIQGMQRETKENEGIKEEERSVKTDRLKDRNIENTREVKRKTNRDSIESEIGKVIRT